MKKSALLIFSSLVLFGCTTIQDSTVTIPTTVQRPSVYSYGYVGGGLPASYYPVVPYVWNGWGGGWGGWGGGCWPLRNIW